MLTKTEAAERWQWPRYNPPGLLIGPVLYKDNVPDYSRPGVAERIRVEIDFDLDQERYRD